MYGRHGVPERRVTEPRRHRPAVILIARYDPAWPLLFAQEAARIRRALGNVATRIDHVGSTSVPNLAAKPVIDIQVSVRSLEPRSIWEDSILNLGYTHFDLGPFDLVYPFFKRPATWPSTHHVHLCAAGSEEERNHLAFRDYLRAHPKTAAEYLELKQELVTIHDGTSIESQENYSLAKSAFVSSVLERAFAEDYPLHTPRDA